MLLSLVIYNTLLSYNFHTIIGVKRLLDGRAYWEGALSLGVSLITVPFRRFIQCSLHSLCNFLPALMFQRRGYYLIYAREPLGNIILEYNTAMGIWGFLDFTPPTFT